MTKLLRTTLSLASIAVIWSVLWGQQPQQQPATADQRLEKIEERLALVEKALAASSEAAGRLPEAALDTRLTRLETRVERFEAQTAREPAGAPSSGYDRMLESRVRALERQISRLR
ncbi:MAG: hypothetical protein WD733_11525 [Bryobacterales bacterium]